nr:hypothetical protein CFP56_23789 [Quercus suber]
MCTVGREIGGRASDRVKGPSFLYSIGRQEPPALSSWREAFYNSIGFQISDTSGYDDMRSEWTSSNVRLGLVQMLNPSQHGDGGCDGSVIPSRLLCTDLTTWKHARLSLKQIRVFSTGSRKHRHLVYLRLLVAVDKKTDHKE